MIKRFLMLLALLSFSSVLFAKDAGLLTYDQYLQSRHLTRDDVECKNDKTEDVLNPKSQGYDSARTVCEVWIKEKPAQKLTFKDGTQVYKTAREWTEEWTESVPRQGTKSGDFVVKEGLQSTVQKKPVKHYVARDSQ
jgi:hypothetical protein